MVILGAVLAMAGAVATTDGAKAADDSAVQVSEVVVTGQRALAGDEVVREGSLGLLASQDVITRPSASPASAPT